MSVARLADHAAELQIIRDRPGPSFAAITPQSSRAAQGGHSAPRRAMRRGEAAGCVHDVRQPVLCRPRASCRRSTNGGQAKAAASGLISAFMLCWGSLPRAPVRERRAPRARSPTEMAHRRGRLRFLRALGSATRLLRGRRRRCRVWPPPPADLRRQRRPSLVDAQKDRPTPSRQDADTADRMNV